MDINNILGTIGEFRRSPELQAKAATLHLEVFGLPVRSNCFKCVYSARQKLKEYYNMATEERSYRFKDPRNIYRTWGASVVVSPQNLTDEKVAELEKDKEKHARFFDMIEKIPYDADGKEISRNKWMKMTDEEKKAVYKESNEPDEETDEFKKLAAEIEEAGYSVGNIKKLDTLKKKHAEVVEK